MSIIYNLIGGAIGWSLGGPIGAILGYIFFSLFNNKGANYSKSGYYGKKNFTYHGDFKISLLVLTASMMKADNKVLKSELNYVSKYFLTQFGQAEAENMLLLLRKILKQNYSIVEICFQISENMSYALRLQIVYFLFGIANADNNYHESEWLILNKIGKLLNINQSDLDSMRAMYASNDDKNYYKILEISETATNEEIKKSYKELAIKHHPDKVSHLGENIRKAAEDKFQQINNAYSAIKKQRNIQ